MAQIFLLTLLFLTSLTSHFLKFSSSIYLFLGPLSDLNEGSLSSLNQLVFILIPLKMTHALLM